MSPRPQGAAGAGALRGAVVSIGDEIALGQSLDTNSMWIASRLAEVGVIVTEHAGIADDAQAITGAVVRLAAAHDIVVCTGGLGPTADDLTRQALASAMGTPLELDEGALAQIKAYFAKRARPITDAQRTQAMRPQGAESIPNPVGTAPGVFGRVGSAAVWCLPGPPGEMRPMFERHAPSLLRAMAADRARAHGGAPRVVAARLIHCCGISEADAAAALGGHLSRIRNPLVGITVSDTLVTLRARFEGPPELSQSALDSTEREIRAALGAHVFGAGPTTLGAAILERLIAQNATISCAESCTGGLLLAALTAPAGASAAVVGGWCAYSNEFKAAHLGVPPLAIESHGAVSAEVARALAKGARERSGARYGIGVTGIAGPTGGSAAKPVGTVFVALTDRGASGGTVDWNETRRFLFSGDRDTVRTRSVQQALAMLWFRLAGKRVERLVGEVQSETLPE